MSVCIYSAIFVLQGTLRVSRSAVLDGLIGVNSHEFGPTILLHLPLYPHNHPIAIRITTIIVIILFIIFITIVLNAAAAAATCHYGMARRK